MESVRFVIITGLSGAGKTVALRAMEDLGYFCIDNLPPALIPRFAQLLAAPENLVDRVALVIDVRGGAFFQQIRQALEEIEGRVAVLFLEADDATLIRRFKETRRSHPLSREGSMREVLDRERSLLSGLRERAHHVVDTSEMQPADLRNRVFQVFGDGGPGVGPYVSVVSFGFKNGIPSDADLVFDVRFLPNPHYDEALRPLNGLDEPVRKFVASAAVTQEFFVRLMDMMDFLMPHYRAEGKTQLVVAIGCTGGRHRSVVLARMLGEHLRETGVSVTVEHRGINLESDGNMEALEGGCEVE